MMTERHKVAAVMRRLYRCGLTTTSGGNVSCRTPEGTVALTASASDKAKQSAEQVAVLTMDGENLTPHLKPSIESDMHLQIYRRNPEVNAVVHAHPVTASAFCATDREISCTLIAESYAILGTPYKVPYACMGTPQLAEAVAEASRKACCLLLENHGVLTTGTTLLQAFDRLEVLENAAKINLTVAALGQASPLNQEQLDEIDHLMGR